MAVVDVVPAAAHRTDGRGATPAAFPISTLVPASAAAICIAASAYCVSTLLSYYATFAVSSSASPARSGQTASTPTRGTRRRARAPTWRPTCGI
jgi:hypothetical protein